MAVVRVNNQSNKKKRTLDIAKKYYQFLQDAEEEERWVLEKLDVCRSTNIGKDIKGALMLLKKHEVRLFNKHLYSLLVYIIYILLVIHCKSCRHFANT